MFMWMSSRRDGELQSRPASMSDEDPFEPADDGLRLLGGDDPLLGQHPGVGDGSLDVVAVQALIEVDGGGEFLDEFVGGLGEAAGPGFVVTHVVLLAGS